MRRGRYREAWAGAWPVPALSSLATASVRKPFQPLGKSIWLWFFRKEL